MLTSTKLILVALIILPIESILSLTSFTTDRLVLTKSSRFRPMVTRSYDQLIYATFPGYSESIIRLESEKIGYKPCDVIFDSKYDIERPLNFDSLANGYLVLSFLGANASLGKYIHNVIVNLEKCKHVLVTIGLNETSIVGPDDIAIVMGEKEFDVFLTSHPNCNEGKACRVRIGIDGGYKGWKDLERIEDAIEWSINSVSDKDFSKGYFYTLFTSNGTIVQRLDKDLEVEHEIELGGTYLHSNLHGHVSICRSTSPHELSCDLLNENLQSRTSTAIIDAQPYRNYIRGARMFNLADGSALLLFVLQVHTVPEIGQDFSVYLQHVDVYGRVTSPIKFQEDLCKDFGEVTLAKMRDTFYCINVSCQESVRTKCVIFG